MNYLAFGNYIQISAFGELLLFFCRYRWCW